MFLWEPFKGSSGVPAILPRPQDLNPYLFSLSLQPIPNHSMICSLGITEQCLEIPGGFGFAGSAFPNHAELKERGKSKRDWFSLSFPAGKGSGGWKQQEHPCLSHQTRSCSLSQGGTLALAILFRPWLLDFFGGIQHLVQLIHYSFQLLSAVSGRALRRWNLSWNNLSQNVSHSFLPWPLTRPTSAPVNPRWPHSSGDPL